MLEGKKRKKKTRRKKKNYLNEDIREKESAI